MTDAEWRSCDEPKLLLNDFLRKRNRKVRLAAIAACRSCMGGFYDEYVVQHLSPSVASKYLRQVTVALAVSERFADGQATERELAKAETKAKAIHDALFAVYLAASDCADLLYEGLSSIQEVTAAIRDAVSREPEEAFSDLEMLCGLEPFIAADLREVFGPPTPTSFRREWLTAQVTALAKAAYDVADFDRLPILADALEDAGCDNTDILDHLRRPNSHVRGCWALDLILGKG